MAFFISPMGSLHRGMQISKNWYGWQLDNHREPLWPNPEAQDMYNYYPYHFIEIWIPLRNKVFVHASVCLYVGTFICLFVSWYVGLFIHSFIHPSARPPARPSVRPSVRSFIHSFIHSFILSFIHSFTAVG